MDYHAFDVRDPKAITTLFGETYKYKLKVTGSILYHLGCDFFRDDDDFICMAPKKYIEKLLMDIKQMTETIVKI